MYIITLLLFFYSPIIALLLCFVCMCFSKKPYLYCILIALCIAIVAFFFEPPSSYDLYRIFEKVEWLKEIGIVDFFEIYSNNLEIVFNLVLYFIVKVFDKHFIPMIFSLIGYLIMFYIICDYSKIKKLTPWQTTFVVIIFLLFYQHMYLISGIRNFIAMILFVLLLYIEKIKKVENNITHLLYLIPLLFHNSMIIFILFRILIEFKEKITEKIVVLTSFITFFAPMVLLKVLELFKNNAFIFNVYTKLSGYINNDSKFYQFLIVAAMILQLLIYLYMYIYVQKKGLAQNKFYRYLKYIIIICISLIPYSVLFDRALVLLSCLTVVLLVDYLSEIKDIHKYNKFLCYSVILLVALFTFRNQIHNYYPSIESAIEIVLHNNFFDLINMMKVIK